MKGGNLDFIAGILFFVISVAMLFANFFPFDGFRKDKKSNENVSDSDISDYISLSEEERKVEDEVIDK